MKKLILFAAVLMSSAFLAACDGGGGSGNAVPNACVAPNYWQNGVCLSPNGNVITTSTTFYDANYNMGGAYGNGFLRITDAGVYKEFLESAMGVCNRSTWNIGSANCDYWASGYLLVKLQVSNINSNQATLAFQAWPQYTWGGGGAGIGTGIPYQNPLQLANSPVSVINNYQGFEVRRNINLGLIQLMVTNGKLQDGSINYQLAFGNKNTGSGKVFATGTLTRSATGY